MKIAAIIQARMGSTRLSGKVMKEIKGSTVLSHVIERVKQSSLIEEIIIATTGHERDDVIEKEAITCGVKVFRGSEEDVLSRYYLAAKENNIDIIVRITSDCPVIDPNVIDKIVKYYLHENYALVTNAGAELSQRSFPRGLDTEVFSFDELEVGFINGQEKYHREHVTPYIYEHSNKIHYYKNDIDYSKYRWTLDTEEDFVLINEIYNRLYKGKHDFYLQDILEIFKHEPKLSTINAHIEQKKIK
ncbi:spore coat polysaccharide biosynthesis protein SpsF [Metabacillus crassostreae]|uniref:cytidylyltransferase domain-containing protein n=1 Tax=Metabacillus crassostreae TaxID=929098 RepID=UPI00195C78D1|nr:glycosyltransferase family protein [Metabacillus crassostreae]MBM7606295.1 spore coat polysaccharide biosynthesis protein SpsF [Metabacillus crassostreae]